MSEDLFDSGKIHSCHYEIRRGRVPQRVEGNPLQFGVRVNVVNAPIFTEIFIIQVDDSAAFAYLEYGRTIRIGAAIRGS